MPKKLQVPVAVLEKAKALAKAPAPRRAEPVARAKKTNPREKVIAALKKLHPMD